MPKKATFITTTVSVTAAMDTQKPHVESEQAHCSEQRHPNILPVHCVPSLTAARRGDEHRLFQAGRQHHVEQDADTRLLHS